MGVKKQWGVINYPLRKTIMLSKEQQRMLWEMTGVLHCTESEIIRTALDKEYARWKEANSS